MPVDNVLGWRRAPVPPRLKRISYAEQRARYHPNPTDSWLADVSRFKAPASLEDLSCFDVKCKVEMIRQEASTLRNLTTELC